MHRIYFPFVLGLLLFACKSSSQKPDLHSIIPTSSTDSAIIMNTVNDIPVPMGFFRVSATSEDFSGFLRRIPLKKDKTVYLFNGSKKINQSAQFAVLDISVGNQNLQQCGDAAMRLRAEYLFSKGRYEDIMFIDNERKEYKFSKPYDHEHLSAYLDKVFAMCGTASLSKQLLSKNLEDAEPGDVLIRGGFPGHAVIIMDVAENKVGRKIFMIAQSYMPAQDIHLLINQMNTDLSPWYYADLKTNIETPEYIFTSNELKTWENKPIRIDND